MKRLIKTFLEKADIYYAKRPYMPRGIDWLWDIRRIVNPHAIKTMFDVGANEGQTVVRMKKGFPNVCVHAFEPVASTFAQLEQHTRGLNRVYIHRVALADSARHGFMVSESNSQLSHLADELSAMAPELDGLEAVEIATLDDFCQKHKIERIDVLKIDTEGWDLNVLKGASQLLRGGQVGFVFVEVCFNRADHTHGYYPAIYRFLDECGFKQYSFYDYYYEAAGAELLFCNALLVHERALKQLR